MKTILVNLPLEKKHKGKLEQAGGNCEFIYAQPGKATDEQIAGAEIIIGNLPPARLAGATRLEFMQLNSSGASEYTRPGVLPSGVLLASATKAYGRSVAEHALAATLMMIKNLHLYRDAQHKAVWSDFGRVRSIDGAVVVIVGLGDIGQYYARLVKALGAYTIGVKRRLERCPEGVDEVCGTAELKETLRRADVVFSVLPGTTDTEHIFTIEHFRAMKKTAVFVNCGRGNAVASEVLYQALTTGEIAAASVDVTEQEPLPSESSLWKLENLLLTPHISGGYHLEQTLDAVVDIAAANLDAFLNGGELESIVDFETGYCR